MPTNLEAESGDATQLRVIVVEPQRVLRELLVRAFSEAGLFAVGCDGVADAKWRMSAFSPRALLIDAAELSEPLEEVLQALHLPNGETPPAVVLTTPSRQPTASNRFKVAAVSRQDASLEELVRALAAVSGIRALSGVGTLTGAKPTARLSNRERQVLTYVSAGADNLKIASCLGISERTVRAHVSNLYRKLVAENRTHLALIGRELGLRPGMNGGEQRPMFEQPAAPSPS